MEEINTFGDFLFWCGFSIVTGAAVMLGALIVIGIFAFLREVFDGK